MCMCVCMTCAHLFLLICVRSHLDWCMDVGGVWEGWRVVVGGLTVLMELVGERGRNVMLCMVVCLYVCVWVCVCVYVCLCVCMCMHLSRCALVCVCVLACMYVEGIYVFYQLFIWVDNGWFSVLPGGEFT